MIIVERRIRDTFINISNHNVARVSIGTFPENICIVCGYHCIALLCDGLFPCTISDLMYPDY